MNKRLRQWIRASEMLEKHDPSILASVREKRLDKEAYVDRVLIFRKSKLEEMREKYGDSLTIWFGDKEDDTHYVVQKALIRSEGNKYAKVQNSRDHIFKR